jgi:hypothetical protein
LQKLLKFSIWYPILIITAAIAIRVTLSIQGWTSTNSDESIMNLMALHIAYHGEHPTFFYGQNYMGAFEAYIGAVLFRIFAPSVLLMRLEMVGFYAFFLVALYALISRLYTRRFALLVLALFALGSDWTLLHQLQAIGGYPELPLFVALLFLVAYRLVSIRGQWRWYWQAGGYALWGCLAGLALWIHVIVAPYILVSGSLLVLWCWRDLLKFGAWAALIGFVIGAWPLLWYNLHATPGQDSLSIALNMTGMGQGATYDFWAHILSSLLVSVPLATGFSSQCLALHLSDQYPFWPTFHSHCIVEQAIWGGGYLVLLIVAVAMACMALWHLRRVSQWTIEDRSEAIQQSVRLFLVIGAVLTLISYIRGSAPVMAPVTGSRYLTCAWVSLPAILWPLWAGVYYAKKRWLASTLLVLRVTSALVLIVCMAYETFSVFREIPQAQETTASIEELSAYLQKAGVTRFYSEYWTCNRLIFLSQEKLICANTWIANGKIIHNPDRYKPYRAIVEAASNPAFVYPVGDTRAQTLEQELSIERISYSRKQMAGYVVYRLSRSVTVT